MVRFILSVLVIVLAVSGRAGEVRPPVVAGTFYERSPFVLDRQLTDLLQAAARPAVTGRLVAAVVPHAGYLYSGKIAAGAYRLLASGQVDRVVLLGPSHHSRVRGVSLPDPGLESYFTPAGLVPIDRAACESLRDKKGFVVQPEAAVREHSLEVQLPFLQKTLQAFQLVPLVCGQEPEVDVDAVAEGLAPLVRGNTLLLASSDFTHFGPNYGFEPFADKPQERLRQWLAEASARVAALDEKGFRAHCTTTGDTICGDVPIRILMATLRRAGFGDLAGQVLDTATSGELTGDMRNSVSYAAIGFFASGTPATAGKAAQTAGTKEGPVVKEHRSGTWTPGLSEAEKTTLFAIARDTLAWCVESGKGEFDLGKYTLTPLMKADTATFVTLKTKGQLRGCIGSLSPVDPLYKSVHENAVNAALRDPRFPPVRPAELPRISVDVSILSPIRDIASVAEFKIGQQGIILEKRGHRAVYLPEVATEQGWTVEETLSSLSQKAGLPPDAWREGARFKVFESVVLSE